MGHITVTTADGIFFGIAACSDLTDRLQPLLQMAVRVTGSNSTANFTRPMECSLNRSALTKY